jgi:flagellar hook protein FlgE
MPFNVALTGIRAASVDLEVTGNNIANASTTGYKQSRVEFADLYANSYLGIGSNPVGDGVRVQNIRQQFSQGNIAFTDNGLDLAINGNGFFILDDSNGGQLYSRAGAFSVNKDGFVVNSSASRLQGFPANDQGVLSGVLGDLVVNTTNLPPVRTTAVTAEINLDATEEVLVERGETVTSDGSEVGIVTTGTLNGYAGQTLTVTLPDGTTTDIVVAANSEASAIASQLNALEGIEAAATTQATIPAAGYANASGTMQITIDGVPFNGYTDLTGLGNAINNSPSLVGITATLSNGDLIISSNRGNDLQFNFNSADSVILNASNTAGSLGGTPVEIAGIANASGTLALTIEVPGVGGPVSFTASSTSLSSLAGDINTAIATNTALTNAGITATYNAGPPETIDLANPSGARLNIDFSGASTDSLTLNTADSFQVSGSAGAQSLSNSTTMNVTQATVGGAVTLTLDDGVAIASTGSNIFATFSGTPFVNNVFDPTDEKTYNHATSTTIYDSLGNPHVMTMYYVKEPRVGTDPTSLWTMYVKIDGRDVGDPLTPGGDATSASYSLVFDEFGVVNSTLSDEILISNWQPVDADGTPNGADGPLNVVGGGILPVALPPNSSNFAVDLSNATQFGGPFAVNDLAQNGFSTGRLIGLDVEDTGNIFARYTNGESQVLGQVALANFNDVNGLAPVGESSWVETFSSGNPIIGAPGTAALGVIRASSLEESNVELSEQLVNLIIAQRNYQANAKTIESANTVTQTIINLR